MTAVVLDASAAVEIALDTPRGLWLAAHVPPDADAVVPAHFFGEAGSALRRMELRGDLKAERASLALRRIVALRLRQVDTKGLMMGAWQLRANVILPDALYVVLPRTLRASLVTADDRLARAPGLRIQVIS